MPIIKTQTISITGVPWRYCGFSSRSSQYSNSHAHEFFGLPVHIQVMLTLYYSLLCLIASYLKKMCMFEFKNTLLLKNAGHHLNLQ